MRLQYKPESGKQGDRNRVVDVEQQELIRGKMAQPDNRLPVASIKIKKLADVSIKQIPSTDGYRRPDEDRYKKPAWVRKE